MRNYKVDPLFRGSRSKAWRRDVVYTHKEVLEKCRKSDLLLYSAPRRRVLVTDFGGRIVTRLVETTRDASSHAEPEKVRTFTVSI